MENEDATFKEYKKVYYSWPRATFRTHKADLSQFNYLDIQWGFFVLLSQQCKILDSNKEKKIMNKGTER